MSLASPLTNGALDRLAQARPGVWQTNQRQAGGLLRTIGQQAQAVADAIAGGSAAAGGGGPRGPQEPAGHTGESSG